MIFKIHYFEYYSSSLPYDVRYCTKLRTASLFIHPPHLTFAAANPHIATSRVAAVPCHSFIFIVYTVVKGGQTFFRIFYGTVSDEIELMNFSTLLSRENVHDAFFVRETIFGGTRGEFVDCRASFVHV